MAQLYQRSALAVNVSVTLLNDEHSDFFISEQNNSIGKHKLFRLIERCPSMNEPCMCRECCLYDVSFAPGTRNPSGARPSSRHRRPGKPSEAFLSPLKPSDGAQQSMHAPAIAIQHSHERFLTKTEWLTSHHNFSFSHHRDPRNTHHGLLLWRSRKGCYTLARASFSGSPCI